MKVVFDRRLVLAVVACVVWLGVTSPGWADVRIVSESEGERTELLLRGNRIAAPAMGVGRFLLNCETGELTIVSSEGGGRYWSGTADEFQRVFDQMFSGFTGGMQGMPDMGGALGGLFGGPQRTDEVRVRVTKVGEETIAGFRSEHYRVETGSGGQWKVYEEIWVSSDLLQLVKSEVGGCIDLMHDFTSGLSTMGPAGMGDTEAVMASPDYQALSEHGFPVKNHVTTSVFGTTINTVSEVVEVSRDPISEDAFTVPSGYRRVSSPLELFGM